MWFSPARSIRLKRRKRQKVIKKKKQAKESLSSKKLALLLFNYYSLKINRENYSSTFYLITLSEEIDSVIKEWGTKECKLKPQIS